MSLELPIGYKPPPEALAALQQIKDGYPFVYLAGAAGVGKSTLITYLKTLQAEGKPLFKGMAIVAPTGIAAINVGAQTIHSFLRIAPTDRPGRWKKDSIPRGIKYLSLLVIDEISMVRADLLDLIDEKLRFCRKSSEPFGGVPVLGVGDIFQLSPVVTSSDAHMFTQDYPSPWFFYAKIFYSIPHNCQLLTKIFRQTDPIFLDILNNIRVANNLPAALKQLNDAASKNKSLEVYPMSLTSTNWAADEVNTRELSQIKEPIVVYKARLADGITPNDLQNYQSPSELSLKKGARVMATANIKELGVVNGHLGWVAEVGNSVVTVKFDFGATITLSPYTWKKISWEWDESSKAFHEQTKGSYTQIPLRLGYAVSIHKAQGLTLDAVSIDLGRGAFASGQTYVALSRCRTLEGLHLTRPITVTDIILDPVVMNFYTHFLAPDPARVIPPPPVKKKKAKFKTFE